MLIQIHLNGGGVVLLVNNSVTFYECSDFRQHVQRAAGNKKALDSEGGADRWTDSLLSVKKFMARYFQRNL